MTDSENGEGKITANKNSDLTPSRENRWGAVWWFQFAISSWLTTIAFGFVGLMFGWGIALNLGCLALAYTIGFLHGAGTEISKARLASSEGE